MAQKKKHGSVKRYGSRYGRRVREQAGVIEAEKHKKHECPYCKAPKVKRATNGIFECRKCKKIFSGKAYSPREETRAQVSQAEPEVPERVEEEVEE